MSYTYRIGRSCSETSVPNAAERAAAEAEGRSPRASIWKFGRFTRNVWVELGEEAKRRFPNPITVALEAMEAAAKKDAAIIRAIIADDEAEMVKAAAEKRPPVLMAAKYTPLTTELQQSASAAAISYLSAGSPALSGFIASHEGCSYLLWLLLQIHDDTVTLDDAYDVYWDLATNPRDKKTGKTLDERKTPDVIISIANGMSPTPAKNGQLPA